MAFFYQSIKLLEMIITAMGAGIGVWGVINLLEGYSDTNSATRSQGVKQMMAGGGIIAVAQLLIPLLANMFTV